MTRKEKGFSILLLSLSYGLSCTLFFSSDKNRSLAITFPRVISLALNEYLFFTCGQNKHLYDTLPCFRFLPVENNAYNRWKGNERSGFPTKVIENIEQTIRIILLFQFSNTTLFHFWSMFLTFFFDLIWIYNISFGYF